jgi:hypothetical protein
MLQPFLAGYFEIFPDTMVLVFPRFRLYEKKEVTTAKSIQAVAH